MATIITKFSSTASAVPTASDLVQGELAVNTADKRLFTEDSGASIIELGTNPSSITTGAITASGTVTSSSGFSGNLTGDVTGDVTGNITGNLTGNVTGDVTGSISGGTVAGSTGTFSSNVTVGGTLGVTGATTLSDNLTMSDGRLQITNSSFNLKSFEVIGSGNTTSSAVYLSADNLTTGKALEVVSAGTDASSRNLVRLANTSTLATGTTVLQIDQSSSGNALSVSGDSLFTGNITVTGNATISGNLTFGDADTDSISLNADVDSHILPNTDDTYDLGSTSKQWRNLYINGTANIDSLVADTADINGGTIDGAAIGSTTASTGNFSTLSINGTAITATSAELNVLDGITSTTAELNYTDGVTSNIQTQLDAKAPLASPTFTGTVTADGLVIDTNTLYVDSVNNRVGIGTTSPNTPLSLNGGQISGVASIYRGTTATTQAGIALDTDGVHRFMYGSSEQVRIDSSGNVGIGTSSPTSYANSQTTLVIEDTTSPAIAWSDTGQTRDWFAIAQGAGLNFRYADGGGAGSPTNVTDLLFLENTGNVGIGTSSPSDYYADNLVVSAPTEGGITIASTATSNTAYLAFADGTTGDARYRGYVQYNHNTDSMLFASSGSEAMRIDSSGNLLVGKTANSLSVEGIQANASALFSVVRDGATTQYLNRLTSDGDIIQFAKDTTTVGSIGTRNGTVYIHSPDGTNGSGLKLADGYIVACESDGSGSDADTDLGLSGTRFKDLYLSGTASVSKTRLTTNNTTYWDLRRDSGTGDFVVSDDGLGDVLTILQSNGNVGIGTSSPTSLLSIAGVGGSSSSPTLTATTGTNYIGWKTENTGGSFWTAIDNSTGGSFSTGTAYARVLWSNGAYPMVFSTNSTERLRIDSSGKVGIGTTSPTHQLSVHNSAVGTTYPLKIENSNTSSSTNGVALLFTNRSNSGDNQGAISYVGNGNNNNAMLFLTEANGVNGMGERMRIDSSGNVGIGTSSPSAELDVVGDIEVSGGVYLGGTTSANLLDDYEEGTFTPVFNTGYSAVTYTAQLGHYTKVGRTVTIHIYLNVVATTASGNLTITGLPFSTADFTPNHNNYVGVCHVQSNSGTLQNSGAALVRITDNSSTLHVQTQSTTGIVSMAGSELGNGILNISITYTT